MDNLLWKMEGDKPREHEHASPFECFAVTEDPDLKWNHPKDNSKKSGLHRP